MTANQVPFKGLTLNNSGLIKWFTLYNSWIQSISTTQTSNFKAVLNFGPLSSLTTTTFTFWVKLSLTSMLNFSTIVQIVVFSSGSNPLQVIITG